MWSTKEIAFPAPVKEESQQKEIGLPILRDGEKLGFKIGTSLGFFTATFTPRTDEHGHFLRNNWMLEVDYEAPFFEAKAKNKNVKYNDYYLRAQKLAFDLIDMFNLQIKADNRTSEKIEIFVYKN